MGRGENPKRPRADAGIALQVEASPGLLPEMGRDANRGFVWCRDPVGPGTDITHSHTHRCIPPGACVPPMAVGAAGLAPCSLQGVKSVGKSGQIGDA